MNPVPTHVPQSHDRLLRVAEVLALTAQSRPTLYREMAAHRFPAPAIARPRFARWRLTDIQAFIAGQQPGGHA